MARNTKDEKKEPFSERDGENYIVGKIMMRKRWVVDWNGNEEENEVEEETGEKNEAMDGRIEGEN